VKTRDSEAVADSMTDVSFSTSTAAGSSTHARGDILSTWARNPSASFPVPWVRTGTKANMVGTLPDVESTQTRRSGLATRVGTPVRFSSEPASGARPSLSGSAAPTAKFDKDDDERMDMEKAMSRMSVDFDDGEGDSCEKDGVELMREDDHDSAPVQVSGAMPDVPVLPTDATLKRLRKL